MNCRKHNATFHQALRTFQRKALHFGNKQNLYGRKNTNHNKTCLFCLLLEHFRNIFCKQCMLSLIWVNTVCHSMDSKTSLRLTPADDMPSQYPISGHYRPASETPFGWRFACGPIVARFYMLAGYSQANYKDKDSTGDFRRTTKAYASLCVRAFAARILKAGMKIQFLSQIQAYLH